MAWARFAETFHYDRRPKQAIAFVVPPGVRNAPRDLVEAAIAAGKAVEIPPPKRQQKSTKTPAA